MSDFRRMAISAIAVAMSLFQLWAAISRPLPAVQMRIAHLTFVLALTYLLHPKNKYVDLFLTVVAAGVGAYIFVSFNTVALGFGNLAWPSLLAGGALVILVLEGARRTIGLALPVLGIIFLLYAFLGKYLPGGLGHTGYNLSRIVGTLSLSTEGILGVALGSSAVYVAAFVIFGAFLERSGVGEFFMKIATSLTGRVRGGPAKLAVVASCLFGTISGSPSANVVTTGSVTIPLMKRYGYEPAFAGAVEAVASTGGMIMPPVMGATAFIIAEILGITYAQVALAALLPALLYYAAAFAAVDFRAGRLGLTGLEGHSLPSPGALLKREGYLLFPIIVLVLLLFGLQEEPYKAAFWAIVTVILIVMVSGLFESRRVDWRRSTRVFIEALENGAKGVLVVANACAAAGVIIGVLSMSGLGVRLSEILVDISGGSKPILLLLTMLASLILGMGLPAVACYMVLAVLVAPALIKLGVLPLAAHLFVFYFGTISNITPPVAIAAYAGAGLAGSDPMKTGLVASRIALSSFIVPYMFVYAPSLILAGSPLSIMATFTSSLLGVVLLSASVEGFFITELSWWWRVSLGAAALLLLDPGLITDAIGYGMLGLVWTLQQRRSRELILPFIGTVTRNRSRDI